jgi:hypothetical protein
LPKPVSTTALTVGSASSCAAGAQFVEHALVERVQHLRPTDRQHRDAIAITTLHDRDVPRRVGLTERHQRLRDLVAGVLIGEAAHQAERFGRAELVHEPERRLHVEREFDRHVEVGDRDQPGVDDLRDDAEIRAAQPFGDRALELRRDLDGLTALRRVPRLAALRFLGERARRMEPTVDRGGVVVEADRRDRVAAGQVHRRERADRHPERARGDGVDLLHGRDALVGEHQRGEEQALEHRIERVPVARLHEHRDLADALVERHQPIGGRGLRLRAGNDFDDQVALGREEVVDDGAAALVLVAT